MKHILIASDLSPEALRPFGTVVRMAKNWGARITLLHVVQDLIIAPHGAPLAPPISSPDLPAEMEAARSAMTASCAELAEGVDVHCEVISGDRIPAAINHYATEHGVDLIALSTHGRTGWRHLALGSVAEDVLRHSVVPVITFPRQKE